MSSAAFLQSCSNMATEISSNFGSGQPTLDLMFLAVVIASVAFMLALRANKKKEVKHIVIDAEIINAMVFRVSELEISVGELKAYVKQNTEHLKGETGYIKYELQQLMYGLDTLRKQLPPPSNPGRDLFLTEEKRLQRLEKSVEKVVNE